MSSQKRKADEAFARKHAINGHSPQNKHFDKLKQRAQVLLEQRQKLPIWQSSQEIRRKASENDVLLLVGETGSGKSTQIPQFLMNEKCCRRQRRKISAQSTSNGDRQADSSHGKVIPNQSNGASKSNDIDVGGCIAILQPRRVAAISLAKRVAEEHGTLLGSSSPASTVGYSVRFDNNCSPNTRIKFMTDGMMLAELLNDPWLKAYSCVVVDEVHERGLNVDLCLGFLKSIVSDSSPNDGRGGMPLKIVVMSATAEMEIIRKFFTNSPTSPPLQQDPEAWEGFSEDEKRPAGNEVLAQAKQSKVIRVASTHIEGRQYPVAITYSPAAVVNLLDAALNQLIAIHTHQPLPGDILVFLSGQEMIENLQSLAETYAQSLNVKPSTTEEAKARSASKRDKLPSLQILPLYAALPAPQQQRIFEPTPAYTRRVILSTDIAETSVTIPNIRYVIDTGKHKARHFRAGLNLDTLLSIPISRSSAAQRSGRAGREAPGHCYRLYTQSDYYQLDQDTPPEILQTDLSFLVLTLKAHGVSDVLGFPLLTPPPKGSLVAALDRLLDLSALDAESGEISDIGRRMSLLPLRVDLGRALVAAIDFKTQGIDILDQVVDVVSALSLEEGIFLPLHNRKTPSSAPSNPTTNGKKTTKDLLLRKNQSSTSTNDTKDDPHASDDSDESSNDPIATARRTLQVRHSDHLTLLRAIQAYTSPTTHDRRAWCDAHAISHRAMLRITDIRKQLGKLVREKRLQPRSCSSISSTSTTERSRPKDHPTQPPPDQTETDAYILKALLTGLWPNTATLTIPSSGAPGAGAGSLHAPYTTLLTKQGIHIHPSSTMFTVPARPRASGRDPKRKRGGNKVLERVGAVGPPAVMFTDLIYTKKAYARNVSRVELRWLEEMGVGGG